MLNTILSIPTYSAPSNFLLVASIIAIVILGLIILSAIGVGIYGLVTQDGDLVGGSLGGFFTFGIFILLPIFVLCTTLNSSKHYPEWYAQEIVEVQYDHIYSLKLNNETSGSFCLGSGRVNTTTYYYFYIKNNHDAFELAKVEINGKVYLKESDETPKVIEKKDANSTEIYTLIYIPTGTIVMADFNVN